MRIFLTAANTNVRLVVETLRHRGHEVTFFQLAGSRRLSALRLCAEIRKADALVCVNGDLFSLGYAIALEKPTYVITEHHESDFLRQACLAHPGNVIYSNVSEFLRFFRGVPQPMEVYCEK